MRKILLITSVLPWPLRRNGGAQRTALLRDAFARHGHVDVLMVAGATLNEQAPDLNKLSDEHHIVGHLVRPNYAGKRPWYLPGPLGSVSDTVNKYLYNYQQDEQAARRLSLLMQQTRYDLIVCRYLQPAMQCGIGRYPHVPAILDFDDIDWTTLASQIAAKPWGGLTGKMAARRVLARVTGVAQNALNQFRHVFVTCDEDALLLPRDADVLPNVPFSAEPGRWLQALRPSEGEELLFVGDLQFPPNRDGLTHFIANVWPKVRAGRPAATLTVIGRGLSDASRALWSAAPGVHVVGFAENLEECYRRCALSVVPIYFGGGTKIKVVESLAYGRAVVTVPQSMRGYAALANNGVAVGQTDEGFATEIVRLLSDPAARHAAAAAGRAMVEKHFSPETFAITVDRTMKDVW